MTVAIAVAGAFGVGVLVGAFLMRLFDLFDTYCRSYEDATRAMWSRRQGDSDRPNTHEVGTMPADSL